MAKKVKYTQPLLGEVNAAGYLILVPGAVVQILQDGDPVQVYSDEDGTEIDTPALPSGVASGSAGVSTRGELTVWLTPGGGYSGVATVGQQATTFPIPDISPDIADVASTAALAAKQDVATAVTTTAERNVLANAGVAQSFADSVTFAGLKEGLRLARGAGLSAPARNGTIRNMLARGEVPAIDGGTYENLWVGSDLDDAITAMAPLDSKSLPLIDMSHVGNAYATIDTWLVQAYPPAAGLVKDCMTPGPVPGDDARLRKVGVKTRDALGVLQERLVFNNANAAAASLATFKNLGAVELLSDTMALKFGTAGDVALARSVAGGSAAALGITAPGGLMTLAIQATDGTGSYVALTGGKVIIEPRGGTPGLTVNTATVLNAATAATVALVANSAAAPTADIQQWKVNGVLASRVGKGGRFITGVATAPVLADLADGELAFSTDASGRLVLTSRVSGALAASGLVLGTAGDIILARSVAGGGAASLDVNTPGGVSTSYVVDRAGTGSYIDMSSGKVTVAGRGGTPGLDVTTHFRHSGANLGFYAAVAIPKQTGVAVTAVAIHAALVNLGLIGA